MSATAAPTAEAVYVRVAASCCKKQGEEELEQECEVCHCTGEGCDGTVCHAFDAD